MTILELIILVLLIPLASIYLSTILIHRITFLIMLFSSPLLWKGILYIVSLSSGIELLEGLFQPSQFNQIPSILGDFSLIPPIGGPEGEEFNTLISFIPSFQENLLLGPALGGSTLAGGPVIVYSNADIDKLRVLRDNKGLAGIYQWKHKESGKIYIGSAVNLSGRLKCYYSIAYISRIKNMLIYKALLKYGYFGFSLSILEYIDISGLSKEEARNLILAREDFYLKQIFEVDEPNTYNMLKVASSWLGAKHSAETIAKMSIAKTGKNNPMFGKNLTAETIAKISEANKGRIASAETKAKLSKSQKSIDRIGINNPASKKVFIFSFESETNKYILSNSFVTCTEAAKYFKCSVKTISIHLKSGKIFKKKWVLSSTIDFRLPS